MESAKVLPGGRELFIGVCSNDHEPLSDHSGGDQKLCAEHQYPVMPDIRRSFEKGRGGTSAFHTKNGKY
ncbi:MAG: hypothetical protein HQL89_13485 [Magnetococcales bacterium]|nr:hypothetical protein [Magnetococcales bacterium]